MASVLLPPLSQISSTKKDTKPGDQRRHCKTEFIKQVLPKFTKPTTDFGFKESTTFFGMINESFDEVDNFIKDGIIDEDREEEDRLERGPFNIVLSESFDELLECDVFALLENKTIASFSFVGVRVIGARVTLCLLSFEAVEFDDREYRFEDTDDVEFDDTEYRFEDTDDDVVPVDEDGDERETEKVLEEVWCVLGNSG